MSGWAIDVTLCKHRKRDVETRGAESGDVLVRVWLLCAELIARESHYHQTPAHVPTVEGLQILVLRRKAALTGDIDHQKHLSRVIQKVLGGAV